MGIFDRFRRRIGPSDDWSPEDFRGAASREVLPGFTRREVAVARLRESFDLEDDDPRPAVYVDEAWAARLAAGEGASDYDLLLDAFADLESQGIVARMNFTCCNTCGTYEITEERTPTTPLGYVFFHQQDAEWLAEPPTTLYLSFGAWPDAPATDAQVGEHVADAVRRQGLAAEWDGTAERRIKVTITDWRKPLPG